MEEYDVTGDWTELVAGFRSDGIVALEAHIVEVGRASLQRVVAAEVAQHPARLESVLLELPWLVARQKKKVAAAMRDDPLSARRFHEIVARAARDHWQWKKLQDEYRRLGTVGPLIHAEVGAIVDAVMRDRPGEQMSVGDVMDLLLADQAGQLRYVFGGSRTLSDFRSLVRSKGAYRALKRAQPRSTELNLRRRVSRILEGERYERVGSIGRRPAYARRGSQREVRPTSEDEIAAAAGSVAEVPRIRPGSSARASMGYTTPDLQAVIALVEETISTAFTADDVIRVIQRVAPEYSPRVEFTEDTGLVYEKLAGEGRVDDVLSPDEEVAAQTAARYTIDALNAEARELLALAMYGQRKVDMAISADKTRPTIDRWLGEEIGSVASKAVEDLSDVARTHAEELIAEELTSLGLLTSVKALLRNDPFVPLVGSTDGAFALPGLDTPARRPSAEDFDHALQAILAIHRSWGPAKERPPVLFSLKWCQEALVVMANCWGFAFFEDDALRVIKEATLPEHLNALLDQDLDDDSEEGRALGIVSEGDSQGDAELNQW